MQEKRTELPPKPKALNSSAVRIARIVALGLFTVYYLYFGLQSLSMAPLQGMLALVAAGALGLGGYRIYKRQKASPVVFIGTLPFFLFNIFYLIIGQADMSFLITSAIPPAISGLIWLLGY